MSANGPFSTPVAGLALEMAVRNQKLLEDIPRMTENQRALINKRLNMYGGDLADYESIMDVAYNPTVNAMRTQAEGTRNYLVGLPEIMEKAMKEGQSSGVTYKNPNTTDWQAWYQRQINNLKSQFTPKSPVPSTPGTFGTADTKSAWAQSGYRPPTQPTGRRLRPIRGSY